MKILVETVISACNAEYGLVALSGRVGAEAEAGEPTEATSDAALIAEHRAAAKAGLPRASARVLTRSRARSGGSADDSPVGVMTVARAGNPFSPSERDVFLYLVGQAAASIENIALHELVAEQAVTDELTGLPNQRAFREVMDKEGARAQRFGHDLSLLILDIDDFKRVNDTHGHLQGDDVLRAIGRVLERRVARDRRAGALRRRGVRRRPAGDGPRRARSSSAERIRVADRGRADPAVDGAGRSR